MAESSKALIAELQGNQRFLGICPSCSENFRLANAVLFSVGDDPPPEAAVTIDTVCDRIKEGKARVVQTRERMTNRAQKTAQGLPSTL